MELFITICPCHESCLQDSHFGYRANINLLLQQNFEEIGGSSEAAKVINVL